MRKVENDSQAIEFCSSGLANTSTNDIAERRFADTHVRVIVEPRQTLTLNNYVFVAEPKNFHGTENQVPQRCSCLSLRPAAPAFARASPALVAKRKIVLFSWRNSAIFQSLGQHAAQLHAIDRLRYVSVSLFETGFKGVFGRDVSGDDDNYELRQSSSQLSQRGNPR